MNLRDLAEADNAFLVEDTESGFATEITLTDLAGTIYKVAGIFNRVGVDIDPETGQLVAGNKSSVTVRLSRFPADNIPDEGWTVEATDITGTLIKTKVSMAMPDRTAGRVTAILKK